MCRVRLHKYRLLQTPEVIYVRLVLSRRHAKGVSMPVLSYFKGFKRFTVQEVKKIFLKNVPAFFF